MRKSRKTHLLEQVPPWDDQSGRWENRDQWGSQVTALACLERERLGTVSPSAHVFAFPDPREGRRPHQPPLSGFLLPPCQAHWGQVTLNSMLVAAGKMLKVSFPFRELDGISFAKFSHQPCHQLPAQTARPALTASC